MYPHKVTYTNRFIPEGFAGCTRGPFIFIRPEYKDDIGLLIHEKTHVEQFWIWGLLSTFAALLMMVVFIIPQQWWGLAIAGMGLQPALYLLSKDMRYGMELEAYRAQLECYPDRIEALARHLASPAYGYDITYEVALSGLIA